MIVQEETATLTTPTGPMLTYVHRPVQEYEPGTWGPVQANERLSPPGGWHNPTVKG